MAAGFLYGKSIVVPEEIHFKLGWVYKDIPKVSVIPFMVVREVLRDNKEWNGLGTEAEGVGLECHLPDYS